MSPPEENGAEVPVWLRELGDLAGHLSESDLEALDQTLKNDPDAVVPDEPRTKAIIGELHPFTGEGEAQRRRAEREAALAAARKAIKYLRRREERVPVSVARLDRDGQVGAALLALMVARPAIRVAGNTFQTPRTQPWKDLDTYRTPIEGVLPSVGRIEAAGLEQGYLGTGFVAGDGLVLTNRHVADKLAVLDGSRGWRFLQERLPVRIDFGEEYRAPDSPLPAGDGASTTFEVEEVLGWLDNFDLALLRVAPRSLDGTRTLPPSVPLAPDGSRVREGLRAFLVGYPGRDEGSPEPGLMDGLFQRIYYVKHLQPGKVMYVFQAGEEGRGNLMHDCSTLIGNSGSCLADLETGDVIGLHYSGFHGRFNLAVALWMLRDDPFLKRFDLSWAD
jgi:hypothetical protein